MTQNCEVSPITQLSRPLSFLKPDIPKRRKVGLRVVSASAWPDRTKVLTGLNRLVYGRVVAVKAGVIVHRPLVCFFQDEQMFHAHVCKLVCSLSTVSDSMM